jgi:hypothetical protein
MSTSSYTPSAYITNAVPNTTGAAPQRMPSR